MRDLIVAIGLDLALFALNIYFAITERGTWIGWFCTAFVIWQVYRTVQMIRAI